MISSEYKEVPSQLSDQLQRMEATADNFALRSIKDANARRKYRKSIAAMSQEVIMDYKNGKFTLQESAERASTLRNQIMVISRQPPVSA